MPITDALFYVIFSGCVMGKVFSVYLVLLLFVITFSLYGWLSGMNTNTDHFRKEIYSGITCLLCMAVLYCVCNYGHYFANIVRYQNIIFEHIYIYMVLPFIIV